MRAAALVLVLVSGCAIGGSSSVVGRWRPRRVIDSTACVANQTPGGGCSKVVSIGRDVPARSFSTLMFTYGQAGYAQRRSDTGTDHGLLLDGHFEYLRGRGRFALGARVGAEVGTGFGKKLLFLMPITVVAHLGDLWGSVYVGAGYSPIATTTQYADGENMPVPPATWHHDSVHVILGSRMWLTRTLERGISFSPELRVQTFDGATLLSLSGNIGLHL